MRVKNIVIKGFKSYREQVEFDGLSENCNVIVGRNGTGKSNFFDAIRFVLCDEKFLNMSHSERQHLLYEGPGDTDVLSAFVEIHFDNTDGRLPVDRDEVVLRRAIGLKKDEFFIDKKHATKQDVISLLEAAGFSKANPYYIVQQGKINALTMMKDKQRLELLQDVAGTRIYDDRRAESKRILAESATKQKNVEEVLSYVDARLAELDEEREELEAFRVTDSDRKGAECAYYTQQMNETEKKLADVEQKREVEWSKSNDMHSLAAQQDSELAENEFELKKAENSLARLAERKKETDTNRERELVAAATARENLKTAQQQLDQAKKDKSAAKKQLKDLHETIERTQRTLGDKEGLLTEATEAQRKAQSELAELERKLASVYAASRTYKSKADRDSSLNAELKDLTKAIGTHADELATSQAALTGLSEQRAQRQQKVDTSLAQAGKIESEREKLRTKGIHEAKKLDKLAADRKEFWRNDAEISAKLADLRRAQAKAKKQIAVVSGRSLSLALDAIQRIALEHGISGVYGPLASVFSAPTEVHTAVETAAKASLFHIVVDTDETATKLLSVFNREKIPGHISFLPLNQLAQRERERAQRGRPSDAAGLAVSGDVRPLLDSLTPNEAKFAPALSHAFRRIYLCRTMAVAVATSKQHSVTCVTLEGERVERRGALSGGYLDPRKSVLSLMEANRKRDLQEAQLLKNKAELRDKIDSIEEKVLAALADAEQREREIQDLGERARAERARAAAFEREGLAVRELEAQKEESIAGLQAALKTLEKTKSEVELELKSPFDKNRQSDTSLIRSLQEQIAVIKAVVVERTNARTVAAAERNELAAMLHENLRGQERQWREKGDDADVSAAQLQVSQAQGAVKEKEASLKDLEKRQAALEKEMNEVTERIEALIQKIDTAKTRRSASSSRLQAESKRVEKLLSERALLLSKRDEFAKKIRDLGTVSSAAQKKFAGMSSSALLKALHGLHSKLKKFAHVNKKAITQYVEFTERRETLRARKLELETNAKSFEQLIESLDLKKEEAIERTFKGVAKHFAMVFAELSGGGKGQLVMQTDQVGGHNGDNQENQSTNTESSSSRSRSSRRSSQQRLADASAGRKRGAAESVDADADDSGDENELASASDAEDSNDSGADGPRSSGRRVYVGVSMQVQFPSDPTAQRVQALSGGQKALCALALLFAIQRSDPAPFYLCDEIDAALDTSYRSAVAQLLRKHSVDAQYILTTFKPELVEAADACFGIAFTAHKVSTIEQLDKDTARSVVLAQAAEPAAEPDQDQQEVQE